jgi:hypothetical protein
VHRRAAEADEAADLFGACPAGCKCNGKRRDTERSRDITKLPDSGHFRPQRVTHVKRNDSIRQHCGVQHAVASRLLKSA